MEEELGKKGYKILLTNYNGTLDCEHVVTWNEIIIGRDTGIQIWPHQTKVRDCRIVFDNLHKNEIQLKKL